MEGFDFFVHGMVEERGGRKRFKRHKSGVGNPIVWPSEVAKRPTFKARRGKGRVQRKVY